MNICIRERVMALNHKQNLINAINKKLHLTVVTFQLRPAFKVFVLIHSPSFPSLAALHKSYLDGIRWNKREWDNPHDIISIKKWARVKIYISSIYPLNAWIDQIDRMKAF